MTSVDLTKLMKLLSVLISFFEVFKMRDLRYSGNG